MSFIRKMKQMGSSDSGKAGPRTAATVFGKHPGWDDHIDDIAIETDLLGETKRWLYVEGIRTIVDHGAWEKLEADQLLEEFDHVFFWRVGDEAVLGRLWSSQDGKGRTRYPMAVCVHGRNLSQQWFFQTALRTLDGMKEQFKQTASASKVRAVLEQGRAELAASADSQAEVSASSELDPRALARLAGSAEFNGHDSEHVGLQRVLYQIERDMAAFRPVAAGSRSTDKSSGDAARAKHMRVPAAGSNPRDIVSTWLSVMGGQIAPSAPVLLILPPNEQWCDLVVGSPTESTLRCLRTTPKATPLATDIPYTIEEEFAGQVKRTVEASQSCEAADLSGSKTSATRSPSAQTHVPEVKAEKPADAAAASGASSGGGGGHSGKPLLVMGVLAIALGCAAVFYFLQRDESGGTATTTTAQGSVQQATPAPPPADPNPDPDQTERYTSALLDQLVIADTNWVSSIRKTGSQGRDQLLSVLAGDPTPAAAELRATLHDIREQTNSLDPSQVTNDAAAKQLAQQQEQLRDSIDQWLVSMSKQAEQLQQQGWSVVEAETTAAVAQVRQVIEPATDSSAIASSEFIPAIEDAALINRSMHEIDKQWQAIKAVQQQLQQYAEHDAVLSAFMPRVEARLAASEDVQQLRERVAELHALAQSLHEAVEAHWRSNVDREHFRAESGLYPPDLDGLDVLEQWAKRVGDERFALLSDEADPRTAWPSGSPYAAMGHQVQEHRRCGQLAPELNAQVQRIELAASELNDLVWDGTRATRQAIEQRVTQLNTDAQSLTHDVTASLQRCLNECEQRLAQAIEQEPEFASAALEARWEHARQSVLNRDSDCQRRLEQLNDTRHAIEQLSELIPLANVNEWQLPHINNDALHEIAVRARESALFDAMERAAVTGQRDVSAWQRVAEDYEQHIGAMRSHAQDIDDIAAKLAALEPASQQAERYTMLAASPMHASLTVIAAPVEARLDAIQEVKAHPIDSDADRERLVQVIEQAEFPEQRYAAWQRLGEGSLHLSKVVEHELRAREALSQTLSDVGREHLLDQLVAEQARRWIEHASTVADDAALTQAIRARAQFGVSHEDPRLDARTKFNIMLHSFSRQLARADDEAEQLTYIQSFRAFMESRRPTIDEGNLVAFDELAATLAALREAEDSTEPDFTRIGPGQAGWSAELLDDGQAIRFRPPASWGSVKPLVFVRVQPPDVPPAYVCTTELPVGLFIATVERVGQWASLWLLMDHAWSADGRDHRRGARVWNRIGDERSAMITATTWLTSESATSYSSQLSVDRPNANHPMQQVSAAGSAYVAGLLGCRLPSYREWHAAYLHSGGEAQLAQANLRRTAWLEQVNHFEQVGRMQAERPDEGGFDLGRDMYAVWPNGASGSTNSVRDVLWFVPVSGPGEGGLTFQHIVGNVAEFVYNGSDELATPSQATHDGSFAQKLLAITDQQQADLYVVGSSSLSRPSAPPTELLSIRQPGHLRVFSDVGFRLAFSADDLAEATVDRAAMISRFLGSLRYLPPAD